MLAESRGLPRPILSPRGLADSFPSLRDQVGKVEVERQFSMNFLIWVIFFLCAD